MRDVEVSDETDELNLIPIGMEKGSMRHFCSWREREWTRWFPFL